MAFEVIDGGKAPKGKRSGKASTGTGLTEKQAKFCEGLASGLSNADAYRAAYDTSQMKPATIHNEASKLSTRPDIAARVEAIITESKRKNSMFTDRQRERHSDRIWGRIWELIDDPDTPPQVKASLLSLGAKAAGMLTDKVEIENKSQDSKSIEAELLQRLQALSA